MYKQLLIATTNQNKVERIKKLLNNFPLPIISLPDLDKEIPEPDETALTCVGIAAQKALAYADYVGDDTIVLCQDDTIIFDGVEASDNPGTAIKGPVIKQYGEFTDAHAVDYYTALAKKYGGFIPMNFHYGHAIAVKETGKRKGIQVYAGESQLTSRLVSQANKPETVPGYFLSAIMQINLDGEWRYYNDLDEAELVAADEDLKASIQSLLNRVNVK